MATQTIIAAQRQWYRWDQLDNAAKLSLIDPKTGFLTGDRHAWYPVESLRQMWDTLLLPRLLNILNTKRVNNEIFGSSENRQMELKFYMTSSSPSWETATPTVVTACKRPACAKKAISILKSHKMVTRLELAYDYYADPYPSDLTNCAGTNTGNSADFSQFQTVCGARIWISPSTRQGSDRWKCATLGGLIQVGDLFYGLTAAHAFSTASDDEEESTTDDESEPPESNDTSADTVSPSHSWVDEDVLDDATSASADENVIYADQHFAERSVYIQPIKTSAIRRADSRQGLPDHDQPLLDDEHLLGTVAAAPPRKATKGLHSWTSASEDWAMLEIANSRFHLPNRVEISGKTVSCSSIARQAPFGSVAVASGTTTPYFCESPGLSAGITLPGSYKMVSAWMINHTSDEGDCGSWVMHPDNGELYGMIVASSRKSNISYCIPLTRIMDEISTDVDPDIATPTLPGIGRFVNQVQSPLPQDQNPVEPSVSQTPRNAENVRPDRDIPERIVAAPGATIRTKKDETIQQETRSPDHNPQPPQVEADGKAQQAAHPHVSSSSTQDRPKSTPRTMLTNAVRSPDLVPAQPAGEGWTTFSRNQESIFHTIQNKEVSRQVAEKYGFLFYEEKGNCVIDTKGADMNLRLLKRETRELNARRHMLSHTLDQVKAHSAPDSKTKRSEDKPQGLRRDRPSTRRYFVESESSSDGWSRKIKSNSTKMSDAMRGWEAREEETRLESNRRRSAGSGDSGPVVPEVSDSDSGPPLWYHGVRSKGGVRVSQDPKREIIIRRGETEKPDAESDSEPQRPEEIIIRDLRGTQEQTRDVPVRESYSFLHAHQTSLTAQQARDDAEKIADPGQAAMAKVLDRLRQSRLAEMSREFENNVQQAFWRGGTSESTYADVLLHHGHYLSEVDELGNEMKDFQRANNEAQVDITKDHRERIELAEYKVREEVMHEARGREQKRDKKYARRRDADRVEDRITDSGFVVTYTAAALRKGLSEKEISRELRVRARMAISDHEKHDKLMMSQLEAKGKEVSTTSHVRVHSWSIRPESLDMFELTWEWEDDESDLIIVMEKLSGELKLRLMEHTAALIISKAEREAKGEPNQPQDLHNADANRFTEPQYPDTVGGIATPGPPKQFEVSLGSNKFQEDEDIPAMFARTSNRGKPMSRGTYTSKGVTHLIRKSETESSVSRTMRIENWS